MPCYWWMFSLDFINTCFFVYLSLFLITFVFFKMSDKINFKSLFVFGFLGSLIFYVVSNFGVWASGVLSPVTNLPYEKNLNGLISCYFLAIPFFKNTLFSTIIFSYGAFLANYFYEKMGQKKTNKLLKFILSDILKKTKVIRNNDK